MDCTFDDLDDRALTLCPEASVSDVFAARGEQAWRDAEWSALQAWLNESGDEPAIAARILALGGGTPMIREAFDALQATSSADQLRLVYLECSLRTLTDRLDAHRGDRPSLTGADPVAEIGNVLAERAPTYRALADLRLDGNAPIAWQVETVLRYWK